MGTSSIDPNGVLISFLIAFGVGFVIFLILREFMCWYWKINLALKLLQSIDESLKQLPVVANRGAARV
jgi:hypothetical protein